jgi:hypothetical protein
MSIVCTNIEANCDECKSELGVVCFATLNIKTELSANTSVYLWVRDKFGNLYRDPIMTEYDGAIIIVSDDFPDGLFHLPQIFDLFVTSDINGSTVLPMFSSPTYNCIKLTIE